MIDKEFYPVFSKVFYTLLFISTFLLIPDLLFAGKTPTTTPGSDNAIRKVICNIVVQLTGPIGQGISTIAIIFIGIGLFMGKISWGLALGITIGIAMLFGAQTIVEWVSGGKITACTSQKIGP
ncbi:MAG: TrbC/VirB2 family protein [Rickettsiaceae bacterium H1]|nr:TrbC/VirB2 family protein [Rickettsiaceae bacterium H1]